MMTVGTKVAPSVTREAVSCRLCSSTNFEPYLEGRGFTIVGCSDCGLYYVNPQPSSYELGQLYSTYDSGDQWRQGEEHFNSAVARAVTRFKQGGTALDVGSGSGNFLRAMRRVGFSVCGVEPSETGSAYAREHHGIETFTGSIEQFLSSGADRQFDVVSILNVLEHLKDPAHVLRSLRAILGPAGVLAVVVPDARLHAVIGGIRKRLGASDPYWMNTERHPLVGFDPPDHLCSFEPHTVARLVEKCGFRVLRVRNAPVVFNQDRWKNASKLVARGFSEVLYRGTFGKVVFGYSTLVIARKEEL
jgi:SAM-dependent methyltransferase